MYARTRQRNIRRTEPLTKSLIELASKAEATQNGYLRRLEQLWLEVHPTLPSRGSALTQMLKRIYSQCSLPLDGAVECESSEWGNIATSPRPKLSCKGLGCQSTHFMYTGTLYQLRNMVNRRNVTTTCKGNVNACEEFLELIDTLYVEYCII